MGWQLQATTMSTPVQRQNWQGAVHLAGRFLACALCVLSVTMMSGAQSGRRQPKASNAPPIQSPAEPEAPGQLRTDKPVKPEFKLLLARATVNLNISDMYARAVMDACMDRLKRAPTIELISAPSPMNRKEAGERAKSDPKTYVALVDFSVDTMGGADIMTTSPDQVVVEFVVFTPGTGKAASTGRVYQRYRNTLPVPGGQSGAWRSLEDAGVETADRILGAVGSAQVPVIKPRLSAAPERNL